MDVRMIPGRDSMHQPNGISRVIEKYFQYGPQFGINFVEKNSPYDIKIAHAGMTGSDCDVAILHGLYFTGDYKSAKWQFGVNGDIVDAVRQAKAITVPTQWVAEIFQRDMHINPIVVPHGIDYAEWDHNFPHEEYVLYNKNRDGLDVCDCTGLDRLASMCNGIEFKSTFSKTNPANVDVLGVRPFEEMKPIVQKAGVYLSITKETFGIGILEALASGVPVLGWRYGGNVDLIQHGVNGYLAEPGNYDDLRNGLFYLIKYRKVLSDNARETAKGWTWENAMSQLKLALDFALTKKKEPSSVSVIVPVYNYAKKVGTAIESVVKQTYPVDEILIVDDGSTDEIDDAFGQIQTRYPDKNIQLLKKQNGGVATARNFGAQHARSKYLCFLDADDRIAPEFIQTCVDALEKDNSLFIAYTKLKYFTPDGKSDVSGWPDKWNFDLQIQRKNQVPTCCVMRREVIERTGGYRQRYAPLGAGSEDADLWTRVGALGMKAELVSEEPLFLYTMGTGNTSKPEYKEVDWLGWNGYVSTHQHPFASYASPATISHAVFQYDEPVVSIVIPVGPGHEKDVTEALDSIEGQTYKKWEAIVVLDTDKEVDLSPWPFVRVFKTPKARSGPGVARNVGARNSRSGFLVFLDADDWLDTRAIEKLLIGWNTVNSIVYSDYIGIATVNPEDIQQFGNRVIDYIPQKKRAKIRHYSADYNCQKAQAQPNASNLYHWCIVTCLIPKAWHNDIGGFDEEMESWEDVDYHWRMARAGKCYSRIHEPLVFYRFDTGNRRQAANPESNMPTSQKLIQYMRAKYERIEKMPCKNCGQAAVASASPVPYTTMVNQTNMNNDSDFELVTYAHPNRGEHMVVGPATGITYGYRSGGDRFLVHKNDVSMMPGLFVKVINAVVDNAIAPAPLEQPSIPEPKPLIPVKVKRFDVETVPGVTPAIAKALHEMGMDNLESFMLITQDQLLSIKGCGETRAKAILGYVETMKQDFIDTKLQNDSN